MQARSMRWTMIVCITPIFLPAHKRVTTIARILAKCLNEQGVTSEPCEPVMPVWEIAEGGALT